MAILLGIGCGISILITVLYVVVLFSSGTDQQLQVGAGTVVAISLLMFVSSLVALIGIIRRAGWARVLSIIAGVAFCLSCVGIVLGVPVIIGSALAKRAG